jgi:hypothetical protein
MSEISAPASLRFQIALDDTDKTTFFDMNDYVQDESDDSSNADESGESDGAADKDDGAAATAAAGDDGATEAATTNAATAASTSTAATDAAGAVAGAAHSEANFPSMVTSLTRTRQISMRFRSLKSNARFDDARSLFLRNQSLIKACSSRR